MSELITITATSVTPAAFEFDETIVREQVAKYAALEIADLDDKAGTKLVKDARIELKKVRTGIEKKRTELKAGALEFGRRVDAVAKEQQRNAQNSPSQSHRDCNRRHAAHDQHL